ncbi:lantibiotic dehydratase [Pedobacter sp. D749]|uniref:lantibiotic dehydratase n=1 Tax=Pedobacter sp. D749 TaxID=2856523 RepID=UPI001C568731|nr:lantibiotic dehydratase [Pedobacter sp. D749]QXU43868.1 lantibiotic dehydratase family protein [Pedobacter sp. D749]
MSVRIFPYSLVRYANLNHDVFNQLTFHQGEKLIETHHEYLKRREELKNTLCDALFPIISEQTDDQLRQQLINLKRKIFNNKRVDAEQYTLIKGLNAKLLSEYFEAYLLNETLINKFFEVNKKLFNHELRLHQKLVQQMALNPALQNALMLSSPVLYTQLKSFVTKAPENFKQKELRMEFSLLRYLSRMAFKTSPFSSFTFTGLMTTSAHLINHPNKNPKVQSKLKLNNILFEYLRSILRQHPVLNEYLLLKINITAEIKGDKIQFLTNFNNIESFQQLPANGLQLLIVNYFHQNHQSVTLAELIKYLSDHVEDASHESIKAYIIKLINTGLFEPGFGFSGMEENWDIKLLSFFKAVPDKIHLVKPLISLFETLQIHRESYATAGTDKRYVILQEAEKAVNSTFLKLQKEANLPYYTSAEEKKIIGEKESQNQAAFLTNNFVPYYFSARNIFFEDCFTDETEVLPKKGIAEFASKTNALAKFLLPLDVMRKERIKMRDFYIKHYPRHEKIKITEFYRDYYFYIKKPEMEQVNQNDQALTDSMPWKIAVLTKLEQQTTLDDTLNLTADFFADLPVQPDLGEISSVGAFVQFYVCEKRDQLYGVINSLLPGMGKVSGRFLSLFDSKIQEDFIAQNESLNPEVIKAELNDASTFNANIHPPLLSHELTLPSGNNIYPADQQINVGNLRVCLDSDTNKLRLWLNDHELYSYDLSLESFYNRSNLYQLLAHFNPDARISLQPFIQLIDQYDLGRFANSAPDVYLLPRITFEETVIIRRKTWRIKTAVIPVQQTMEADFEYFIRLHSWFELQKIPINFFLFLRKRSYQNKAVDGEINKKEGLHDDYKPQYLTLDKPLFVAMFKRLLARAGNNITIEEVLPVPVESGVKEYLMQWYNG